MAKDRVGSSSQNHRVAVVARDRSFKFDEETVMAVKLSRHIAVVAVVRPRRRRLERRLLGPILRAIF